MLIPVPAEEPGAVGAGRGKEPPTCRRSEAPQAPDWGLWAADRARKESLLFVAPVWWLVTADTGN